MSSLTSLTFVSVGSINLPAYKVHGMQNKKLGVLKIVTIYADKANRLDMYCTCTHVYFIYVKWSINIVIVILYYHTYKIIIAIHLLQT